MSIRGLAEAVGLNNSTICHIESGQSAAPVWLLVALAEMWDCTLDDLVPVVMEDA